MKMHGNYVNGECCVALLTVSLMLFAASSFAQKPEEPPEAFSSGIPINCEPSIKLSDNSRAEISSEICDPETVRAIASHGGVLTNQLASIRIARGFGNSGRNEVWLYLLDSSHAGNWDKFAPLITQYVLARKEGHSKDCLHKAVTNRVALSAIADMDLRKLLELRPFLPANMVEKEMECITSSSTRDVIINALPSIMASGYLRSSNGTQTSMTNASRRNVTFRHVDGEVAWNYVLAFKADGTMDDFFEFRLDAKEFDPKYQKAIEEVTAEVRSEMETSGELNQLGSASSFWRLKKQKLETRSIKWRSPDELNPSLHME